MTLQELISIVAEQIQISEDRTTEVVDVIIKAISDDLLEDGLVVIEGFGAFKTQKRAEYILLNSTTGERMLMPPEIEIVFESYLSQSLAQGSDMDSGDNHLAVEVENKPLAMLFEPDASLRNSINSAFINFEPTLLNEGVEIPGIKVISDAPEEEETDVAEDTVALVNPTVSESPIIPELNIISETPVIPETAEFVSDTTEVSETVDVPETVDVFENQIDPEAEIAPETPSPENKELKVHQSVIKNPPKKQRNNNRRIWVPVMGGVAITLAALFFFNGTANSRRKQK